MVLAQDIARDTTSTNAYRCLLLPAAHSRTFVEIRRPVVVSKNTG